MHKIGKTLEFEGDVKLYKKVNQNGDLEYWKCEETGLVLLRKKGKVVGQFKGEAGKHKQSSLSGF